MGWQDKWGIWSMPLKIWWTIKINYYSLFNCNPCLYFVHIAFHIISHRPSEALSLSKPCRIWPADSLQAYADVCKTLKLAGATDVRSYLEEHDIIKLFPLLDKYVRNELLPVMSKSPLTSHLSSFSSYGQVSIFGVIQITEIRTIKF